MKMIAADSTYRIVMDNSWYAYLIQCSPDVAKSAVDRQKESRLSKQTMQITKFILENIIVKTPGTLPS